MADASVSSEGNYNTHWVPSIYSAWLTLMSDVQTEGDSTCAKAVGIQVEHKILYKSYDLFFNPVHFAVCTDCMQGDSNIDMATGQPDCYGAVGDLTPGRTPARLDSTTFGWGIGNILLRVFSFIWYIFACFICWSRLPGDPSWMFAYPLVYTFQFRYAGDYRLARTLYPGLKV